MGKLLHLNRPVRERNIEQRFRKLVEVAGYDCIKLATPGRRSYPDRLLLSRITPGHTEHRSTVMFIEFKAPGGKLTKLQAMKQDELRQRGYQVVTVSSHDEANALLAMLGVNVKT
jgi:hypothetical protein